MTLGALFLVDCLGISVKVTTAPPNAGKAQAWRLMSNKTIILQGFISGITAMQL